MNIKKYTPLVMAITALTIISIESVEASGSTSTPILSSYGGEVKLKLSQKIKDKMGDFKVNLSKFLELFSGQNLPHKILLRFKKQIRSINALIDLVFPTLTKQNQIIFANFLFPQAERIAGNINLIFDKYSIESTPLDRKIIQIGGSSLELNMLSTLVFILQNNHELNNGLTAISDLNKINQIFTNIVLSSIPRGTLILMGADLIGSDPADDMLTSILLQLHSIIIQQLINLSCQPNFTINKTVLEFIKSSSQIIPLINKEIEGYFDDKLSGKFGGAPIRIFSPFLHNLNHGIFVPSEKILMDFTDSSYRDQLEQLSQLDNYSSIQFANKKDPTNKQLLMMDSPILLQTHVFGHITPKVSITRAGNRVMVKQVIGEIRESFDKVLEVLKKPWDGEFEDGIEYIQYASNLMMQTALPLKTIIESISQIIRELSQSNTEITKEVVSMHMTNLCTQINNMQINSEEAGTLIRIANRILKKYIEIINSYVRLQTTFRGREDAEITPDQIDLNISKITHIMANDWL